MLVTVQHSISLCTISDKILQIKTYRSIILLFYMGVNHWFLILRGESKLNYLMNKTHQMERKQQKYGENCRVRCIY